VQSDALGRKWKNSKYDLPTQTPDVTLPIVSNTKSMQIDSEGGHEQAKYTNSSRTEKSRQICCICENQSQNTMSHSFSQEHNSNVTCSESEVPMLSFSQETE